MAGLKIIYQAIKTMFMLIIAPIFLLPLYFFELYKSVALMTFKGQFPKRYKKSYYDLGSVSYRQERDRNKRFENQVLGAIVFIPTTIVLLVLLAFIISYVWKSIY